MSTVITVEKLGKKYTISHQQREEYSSLRDVITNGVRTFSKKIFSPFTHHSSPFSASEDFWALKDVSFEVKQGDRIGIIGRNGAGKSTLLKILSRITEPTTGSIRIKGRVASLLEVGTGFHPELTGRENIYLNGAILGMQREEIRRKFDEIVDFAEIEKFLDTPVKRYSSGMYVRLAFAVAAHLEPEILIVDEVLAVGDAQFQKKCLGKMEEVGKEGRTVLFVSHNMGAVEQLTQKSLLLNKGAVQCYGFTSDVVGVYLNESIDSTARYLVENSQRRIVCSQVARFVELYFLKDAPVFEFDESIRFVARVKAAANLETLRFSMTVFSTSGSPVGSCFGPPFYQMRNGDECQFDISIPNPRLAPGSYCCAVAVGKGDNKTGYVNYDVVHDILFFEVRPFEGTDGTLAAWSQGWGSTVYTELKQALLS